MKRFLKVVAQTLTIVALFHAATARPRAEERGPRLRR